LECVCAPSGAQSEGRRSSASQEGFLLPGIKQRTGAKDRKSFLLTGIKQQTVAQELLVAEPSEDEQLAGRRGIGSGPGVGSLGLARRSREQHSGVSAPGQEKGAPWASCKPKASRGTQRREDDTIAVGFTLQALRQVPSESALTDHRWAMFTKAFVNIGDRGSACS